MEIEDKREIKYSAQIGNNRFSITKDFVAKKNDKIYFVYVSSFSASLSDLKEFRKFIDEVIDCNE